MKRQLLSVLCSAAALVLLLAALPAAAHFHVYSVVFSGPAESPSNTSPAVGTGTVSFDLDILTMRVQANFSGLLGNVTAAHIHCCTVTAGTSTADVATVTPTFPGFPSGVTSGTYDQTFDLALAGSYNPAFITANGGTVVGALNALALGAEDGKAYFNIHTTAFPGGEIRGFLVPLPGELLDVDGSASFDALTDGLLVLRYLFGLTGPSLINGALSPSATRTDAAVIKDYLDDIRHSLDVDGNGKADALTDGLLIMRYLFGLRGNALVIGAVDPTGTRTTATDIAAYIQTLAQ